MHEYSIVCGGVWRTTGSYSEDIQGTISTCNDFMGPNNEQSWYHQLDQQIAQNSIGQHKNSWKTLQTTTQTSIGWYLGSA